MFKASHAGFGAVLALAAGLASAAVAGPSDTRAALSACATGFPTPATIASGFAAAGFVSQGDMGGMQMFLSPDGKTVAGTKGSAETGLRCVVMEHKLSTRKAGQLVDALLRQMPGASKLTPPTREVTVLYSGMLNNRLSNVFVARRFEFGPVAGAALLVEAE
ncbi:hypothetical protein [Frigidibacter sp. ROC022]|uniref:hypothetical protein n=1 Tax=Frigidibacter sp. ROC022 TaxID=2971796 RepID=UPI00215B45F8|nr:hypothetical protein [Frigidibacter sp. ROC022]MCR8724065.1 hypothetical protein [Frigidibacter sp. ROC022]